MPYLLGFGFEVELRNKNNLSVRLNNQEVYRLTKKPHGIWLWCHRDGQTGGDNLDLVRELEGHIPLVEAIHRLDAAGGPCRPSKPTTPLKQQHQSLPKPVEPAQPLTTLAEDPAKDQPVTRANTKTTMKPG